VMFDFEFDERLLRREHMDNLDVRYQMDYACYELPEKVGRLKQTTVPSFPDISAYFTVDRLTEKLLTKPVMMGMRFDDQNGVESILFNQFHIVNTRGTYRSAGMKESNMVIPGQLLYDLLDNGDCGTLLLACEPAGKVTIVGMHVAERPYGTGQIAMGFPMWQGMFDRGEAQAYKTKLEQTGRLSYAPPPVEKPTKIVKSPLFDHDICKEVTKRPAHLGSSTCPFTAEELIYRELDRGFADDEYKAYPYDQEEYAEAQAAVRDSYFRVSKKDEKIRKLTMQEALSGGAGGPHKGLAPLSFATCSGDPWCFLPGAHGKHHLFRGEAGNREIWNMDFELFFNQYLDKLVDEDMGDYMEKVVLFLKDELRSAVKTAPEDPKTRVIQCFGAHHLLAMRMFFGAFTDFVHTNHMLLPSSVGMDPYSLDWDTLIQTLRQVGNRGFDGDYKKFEKYFCEQIAKGFVELVNEWYATFGTTSEQEDLARYNLVMMTLECQLVVGNKCYLQRGQLKSGVSLTSIMGSYMNDILLRLAWTWVHKHLGIETDMSDYDANVRKSTFSDDNINVVSDKKLGVYNFLSVRDAFARHGIEYTPADKSDNEEAHKHYTELEFLKCKTRTARGMVNGASHFAVPTDTGDFTSLAWISKGLDPLEAVASNAGSLLMRHFGRGRQAYKELSDRLRLALQDIGSTARLPTYEEALYRYKTGVLNRVDEADELIYQVIDEHWGPRSIFLTNEMRNFYRHIVPAQRQQMPMTIEIWQQTYLEDIPGARCQMMGDAGPLEVEPVVSTIIEPRAVGEVGDSENRSRSWQGADLTDLMKRFTIISTVTVNHGIYPINYLLLQNPSIDPITQGTFQPFSFSQGALYQFARMYAFWWSGFRFRLTGNMNIEVGFMTELPVDQPLLDTFPGQPAQSIGLAGPFLKGLGAEEGPFNFQVDPYTQWNFFRRPLNQTMADNDTFCCDNKLIINALTSSTRGLSQFYGAAGDNPYFFCLREVPMMTFLAPAKRRGAMVDLKAKPQSGTGVNMVSSAVTQAQENVKPYLNPNHVHGGAEVQYQLTTMAERRQLIEVFDWSTSHAENTIIASYSVPGDLIKGSASVPFNSFTYWAGETHVYFELNSTFSMEGLLLIYFVPDMPIARINQHIGTSKVSQLLNPHMWVDLGGSRSCLFKIPFLHPLLRFDTAEINVGYSPLSIVNLGTLVVSVFNPILVGAEAVATTARISTYASFPTGSPSSWTLLRGNPLTLFPLSSKGEEMKDEEVVIRKKSRKGMLLDLKARPQGVVGSIMGGAGSALRVAKRGVDAAIAIHNVVSGLNDKPALTQPMPLVMRGRSLQMCNVEGVEQFAQLGARLSEMRSLTPNDVGTTVRETNIEHIANQWHYLEVILWGTSDTVGDVLLNQPTYITPGILSSAAAGGFPFQPTALEYIIHQWNYWSCKSYEYRLLFTKSKVTSGRLFVSVTYQAEDLSPVTFEQAVAGYGVYLDITGDEREYVIEVPWNSDRCRYPVPHSPGFTNLDSIAYALITVWVVNSLVIDITGPQQIYINTFFRVKGIEPEAAGYGTWNMQVIEPYT